MIFLRCFLWTLMGVTLAALGHTVTSGGFWAVTGIAVAISMLPQS